MYNRESSGTPPQKKRFLSGIANKGWGAFFALLPPSYYPLIFDIKVVSCAGFLVIFYNKMIKRTKIIITITIPILVVIFALLLDFVLCLK